MIVPGGGLVEESRGEGVLDRSVVGQQHRVRRTFGPAQYRRSIYLIEAL